MRSIVGFGSLLSEQSARSTFPALQDFRLVRLIGWRRVFAHPAAIFIERGIASLETRELASLSIEPFEGAPPLLVSCFAIPEEDVNTSFVQREEEFRFVEVEVEELAGGSSSALACARSTDEAVLERWGSEWFRRRYVEVGIHTIWDWQGEIWPCRVYLRHCVLAAGKMGKEVRDSFLDCTFLYDRATTVRAYLAQHPSILEELPPPGLRERYGG